MTFALDDNLTYFDISSEMTLLNGVPGSRFDPRAIDNGMAAKDAQSLHAEDTTVKSELFYSSVFGLSKVGMPFFVAR